MVDTEELRLKLKKTRHVRKGHRSSVTRTLAVARELVEKARSKGRVNEEARCQLSALEEKLGNKAALLRKLDEQILDLTIEVDEDKFEEEVLSADAYDEDVSCVLKAIAGVLRDRPTSGTGATQRLDPKTEAVPSTPGTSATQRVALKTEASPVPCDDQALDFEEGDQPDGPADISTLRASADQGILIGADFYWKLADGEIVRCAENLVAMSTKVGWILSGSLPVDNEAAHTTCMLSTVTTEKLDKQLKQFWDLESLGIKETDPALARFNQSIEFDGGNYFVDLPWKEVHPTRCMKKILRSSLTTEEELLTLLLEVHVKVHTTRQVATHLCSASTWSR